MRIFLIDKITLGFTLNLKSPCLFFTKSSEMFKSKPERPKMKPVLFPEVFFVKERTDWDDWGYFQAEETYLLKYFPKYYKHLDLGRLRGGNRSAQSRIQKLKIVRSVAYCYGYYMYENPKNDFKKLLRTSRKTVTRIPSAGGYVGLFEDFSLCLDFPKVKTLDLIERNESESKVREEWSRRNIPVSKKEISASYGHFWGGCGERIDLKVALRDEYDLILFKKIDSSKRFLSHLKRLELSIFASSRSMMTELMVNKNLLRHVTHLTIQRAEEKIDWELVQSVLNYCPQLYSLSLPSAQSRESSQDFCLDLSCLQNLKVLEADVNHIRIFLNGIDFSPSLREMTLKIQDYEDLDNFSDIFETQQDGNDNNKRMIEEEDARDWISFEKHKVLSDFFEKCKKLSNLRALDLTFDVAYQMDIFRLFLLPFLGITPQLETLNLSLITRGSPYSREDKVFDLEIFLSEIGSLHSLKHLRINAYPWDKWTFSGSSDLQQLCCLSNLSSIEIKDARIYSDFDFKKFFKAFLESSNVKRENIVTTKTVKFAKLALSSTQYFIRILNLMLSVSHFRKLQVDLEIDLIVQSIDEIYSKFHYPICVAHNTRLKLHVGIIHFKDSELTLEQKQYFKMIFGQLQFTINTAHPIYKKDADPLHPGYFCDENLMIYNISIHN